MSNEPRATRHQLRKQFHGPVLKAFSEQVWLFDPAAGKRVRYAKPAWKVLLARQFLEAQFNADGQLVDPPSTETPTDDEFRLFMHEVQAFGVDDLRITFPEADAGQQPARNTKG